MLALILYVPVNSYGHVGMVSSPATQRFLFVCVDTLHSICHVGMFFCLPGTTQSLQPMIHME